MSWFFGMNILVLNTKWQFWVDIDWVVGNEVVVMSLKVINGAPLLMVANLLGVTGGGCSFCHERSHLADKDKIVWPFFNRKGDRTSQTVSLLVLVLWTLQPAYYFEAVDIEFYVSVAVMGTKVTNSIHPPTLSPLKGHELLLSQCGIWQQLSSAVIRMIATVIINDSATSFSDQNDCHSVSASLDSSRQTCQVFRESGNSILGLLENIHWLFYCTV